MIKKTLIALLAIGSTLAMNTRADLIDNFDSYTSQAQFEAVWTDSTGTGLTLNTAEFDSSPNSVKNPGTAAQASRQFFSPINASSISISYDFYDYDAGNGARDFLQVQARSGTEFTGGLANLLAIGKYNTISGTKYYGRVSTATGAVYGDGAGTPVSTWFQLSASSPDKSVGWHSATILGMDSTAFSGKVRYEFYIDGILGASVDNLNAVDYNWAVLGSGLSTAPSGIAFDNVAIIQVVPEPSAAALALLGGFGLLVARMRRQ
jgi:hypothetical protein